MKTNIKKYRKTKSENKKRERKRVNEANETSYEHSRKCRKVEENGKMSLQQRQPDSFRPSTAVKTHRKTRCICCAPTLLLTSNGKKQRTKQNIFHFSCCCFIVDIFCFSRFLRRLAHCFILRLLFTAFHFCASKTGKKPEEAENSNGCLRMPFLGISTTWDCHFCPGEKRKKHEKCCNGITKLAHTKA